MSSPILTEMIQYHYPFNEIQRYFSSKTDIALVIVFGSFARSCENIHSDIDIAIASVNHKQINAETVFQYSADLNDILNRKIDLVDLYSAEGIFLHRIMTTGKRIKNTHNVNDYFAQKALDFISDYYPIYRRDQDIRLKRLFSM